MYKLFITALFGTAKYCKVPKCLSIKKLVEYKTAHTINELLSSYQKERSQRTENDDGMISSKICAKSQVQKNNL